VGKNHGLVVTRKYAETVDEAATTEDVDEAAATEDVEADQPTDEQFDANVCELPEPSAEHDQASMPVPDCQSAKVCPKGYRKADKNSAIRNSIPCPYGYYNTNDPLIHVDAYYPPISKATVDKSTSPLTAPLNSSRYVRRRPVLSRSVARSGMLSRARAVKKTNPLDDLYWGPFYVPSSRRKSSGSRRRISSRISKNDVLKKKKSRSGRHSKSRHHSRWSDSDSSSDSWGSDLDNSFGEEVYNRLSSSVRRSDLKKSHSKRRSFFF